MLYRTKRKIAYILIAIASSQIWYDCLVDGLCDTPMASFAFALAQVLTIALPFVFCLVWKKKKTYNRINFVIVYFFVLGICDYLHNFLFNMLWEFYILFDISADMLKSKFVLTVIMSILRIVFSLALLRKSYKSLLIVSKFKDE